ncbi:hypothetical protein CC80DRAFT_446319 [Byssothecium circinans]|uniref:C2H2-type domain-containing protein n=1 Tax=Byssothecium circinans TaxID=147558 RepID=A0A6A5TXG9_9PLEO|nr:hypothetical protein CC80DRAFT_446319 [Byssothecium circinans]
MASLQSVSFQLALERFKKSLSPKEKKQFGTTTFDDLQLAADEIQKQHASTKKMQSMRRLEGFLEAMKEYDKVIQVFVNTSEVLAFVWGPMKFLLQIACTFAEAFDALMNAYQRIGEVFPLLVQYAQHFHSSPHMGRVLSLLYEDILRFHWKAMRYFKSPMWKQLFHAVWRNFSTEFDGILLNMREHRLLIETQANIVQFSEIIRSQETANRTLESQQQTELRRQRDRVNQWLSAAKYEADQEQYSMARHAYPGTGQWLLKTNRFHSWFDPDFCSNELLWLTGIPGAGKTILASLVIEEARKLQGVTVAFFYCKYQDAERNTFLRVARGVLAQLFHQDEGLLTSFYDKASKSGQTTLETDSLAKELLKTATKSFQKLYIILDGIDECDRDHRKEIVSTFEGIWETLGDNAKDSLRCLFVSQDDSAAAKDFARMVSLKVTQSDSAKDIRSYARIWSSKIQNKFGLDQERQSYIEDIVTEKADGMFLFARLMSSYLYHQTSVGKLNEELSAATFPQGPFRLDEVYSRITQRVFGEGGVSSSDSKKLLSWLVCAKRPLKWREIQCAVAINLDEQTINWEQDRFVVDSKELCGSLVEVRTDDTVDLVHHTTKRYLVEKNVVDIAAEELSLTLLCLGYLKFPCFDADDGLSDIGLYIELGYCGFFNYAYAYWCRHVEKTLSMKQAAEGLQELSEVIELFIDMYWKRPQTAPVINIPKYITDRLKTFCKKDNIDRVASAIYLAKRQLLAPAKSSSNEEVLTIHNSLKQIRTHLEDGNFSIADPHKFQQMYGSHIFKCPRVNCVWFYSGFTTKQERDDHVLKHDRAYFCSFPGCHISTLGCATLKDLQKHETDSHGTISLDDDDAEYPEFPPEKVSFDCDGCGQSFTRKHSLKNHVQLKHSGTNVKRFVCRTCGQRFVRQWDLTRHQTTSHSNAKKFCCGGTLKNGSLWGCGKEFNRGDMLNRHWKSEKGRLCILPQQEEEGAESSNSASLTPNVSTPI